MALKTPHPVHQNLQARQKNDRTGMGFVKGKTEQLFTTKNEVEPHARSREEMRGEKPNAKAICWTHKSPPRGKSFSALPAVTLLLEDNQLVYALIDSGATISMMGNQVFEKIFNLWDPSTRLKRKRKKEVPRIVSASGNIIPGEGIYEIQLTFDCLTVFQEILIVKPTAGSPFEAMFDLILGIDFLKEHQATLCLKNGVLQIGPHKIAVHAKEKINNKIEVETDYIESLHVIWEQEIRIAPGKMQTVSARIPNKDQYGEFIEISTQMMTTPGLIYMTQQREIDLRVDLTIKNEGMEEILVTEGQEEYLLIEYKKEEPTDLEWKELAKQVAQQATTIGKEDQERLFQLLADNRNVLWLKTDPPGRVKNYEVPIHLESEEPINLRQYPLTHEDQIEVKKQVETMVQNGIISESDSPWNFPVIFVNKKIIDNEGNEKPDRRMCVDLRALNERSKKINFPIPTVDSTIQSLNGCQYFSSLDVLSGFWHLSMEKESRKYLAFSTPWNHYEFNVLPFGWVNSPFYFQQYMQTHIANKLPHCVQVYIVGGGSPLPNGSVRWRDQ